MSLNKCQNCGCEDALVTLPPCPTPAGCPDPEPCSEVFDAQCIIYTGADIDCGDDTVIPTDTNVATALNDVVTYFCQELNQQKLKYIKEINKLSCVKCHMSGVRCQVSHFMCQV